jgi:hypothetical protein
MPSCFFKEVMGKFNGDMSYPHLNLQVDPMPGLFLRKYCTIWESHDRDQTWEQVCSSTWTKGYQEILQQTIGLLPLLMS